MERPEHLKQAILPSPLQSLCADNLRILPVDANRPSDLSLHALAIQIQHNLQYQHSWTDLCIHTHSPVTGELFPRPLISGLPASRLYVHPDEQIELLKKVDQEKSSKTSLADGGKTAQQLLNDPEREWILPTRLSEKWTLRRLHDIFCAVTVVPPHTQTDPAPESSDQKQSTTSNPWRTTKRVVLATATTDSTVAYYIIHEGAVKPRQN